jgi:hypothetical protein
MVKLIVTIGYDAKLLPRFIQHYRNLGIEDFLFVVNDPSPDQKLFQYVKDTLALENLSVVCAWSEEFSEAIKQKIERDTIEHQCNYDDWVLYTDLDEFQEYPGGLYRYLDQCEKKGIDYLESRLVDRVANDGSLTAYDPKKSLELQYPLGGFITAKLLKGWDKKIVAARAYKRVGGGHHVFLRPEGSLFRGYDTLPYKSKISPHSCGIRVHHFKWDVSVIPRMLEALTYNDSSLVSWKKEISRFLTHVSKYNGINIKDRAFKFSHVVPNLNI